jgi:DNA-binding transcriptional regulator YhcF (GntR family)
MNKHSIIYLNPSLPTSKYRQIIDSVFQAIENGKLKTGDKMPSINEVCKQWGLSRDTVVNAYNEIKKRGIISSAAGKGFYIERTNVDITHNIFLLFDELNSFKEVLYDSFLKNLRKNEKVDIFFHHFNRKLFAKLIEEANGHYTTYIVMPAKFSNTRELLQTLSGRVIILDQLPNDLEDYFPSIHQNFEKDTYNALMAGKELIKRYEKLIMVYPGGKEPEGQYQGFIKFCNETSTDHELIHNLNSREIKEGEAYIAIWDEHMVWLVKEAGSKGYVTGKDIGIISYNDTPLKEVVANGITTISTDFAQMGSTLAKLISSKENQQIENASSLIVRGSL